MITWLGAWVAMYALTPACRRVACLGPKHNRARAEVGSAVHDLCCDVGVRAVAVQELPGDGHPGFVQFGDARLEQRLRVRGALEVGGVPRRRARPSRQRARRGPRRPRARASGVASALTWREVGPPTASTIGVGLHDRRGGKGRRERQRRDCCGNRPQRIAVRPQHADADRCHSGAEVERRLDADMLAEPYPRRRGRWRHRKSARSCRRRRRSAAAPARTPSQPASSACS